MRYVLLYPMVTNFIAILIDHRTNSSILHALGPAKIDADFLEVSRFVNVAQGVSLVQ